MGLQNDRKPVEGTPLSLAEMKTLISDAAALGAKVLALSGEGEPLFSTQFREVVAFAHAAGLIPFIATNGRLLDERRAAFLAENGATVTISLDTLEREQYEAYCGVNNSFGAVMKNIEIAKHIFGALIGEESGFRVLRCGLHTIVHSENVGEVERLRDFAGDELFFSVGTVAAGLNNGLKLPQSLIGLDEPLLATETETGSRCGFFHYGLSVGFDGEILFDAHAIGSRGIIGNIRELGVENAAVAARSKARELSERLPPDEYCIARSKVYASILASLEGAGK